MVKLEELKRFETLSVFDNSELEMLATIGQLHIFSEDKKIFKQNTKLQNLYFMVSGEISLTHEISSEMVLILSNIRPGTFFGISALCGVKTYHNAYCFKPSEVIAFPIEQLENVFRKNLNFGLKFHYEMIKFYHKITYSKSQDVIKAIGDRGNIDDIDILSSIVDFSV
ncbi:hypothetical protein JCM13304A_12310 [Desulfothermus okinawensis JCM 13304]